MPSVKGLSPVAKKIVKELQSLSDPEAIEGMARFGISSENTYGVSVPELRRIAKSHRKNHELALELWSSRIHEARILASMVDDPGLVTEAQMDSWVEEFDSWDVCDQTCLNLFDKTPFAYKKAVEWAGRDDQFVKRAGFALMACLAWHDKEAKDNRFRPFFKVIENNSTDGRNYVKKSVNWALRQIGKRNRTLNRDAIATARRIKAIDSKSAKWIAADAIRELTSKAVQNKLKNG